MLRGSAAAAAHVGSPCLHQLRSPGAEISRRHREDGLAVYELGHAGIWLDADRLGGIFRDCLDDRYQLLRAKGAVDADDVRPHGIQGNGGSLRVRACYGASVFAVGKLADNRQAGGVLGCQQGGTHFLNINKCLNEDIVSSGSFQSFRLLEIILVRFLKVQIPQRLDETSGRTHAASNLDRLAVGSLYSLCRLYGSGIEFYYPVLQAVMLQLQGGGAKSKGFHDIGTGICIALVYLGDLSRICQAEHLRTGSRLQKSQLLKHGAHGTVKNMYHNCIPRLIIFCQISMTRYSRHIRKPCCYRVIAVLLVYYVYSFYARVFTYYFAR